MDATAVVLIANGEFRVEQRPVPARPGPDWSLIRVVAAGVCGSDIPRAFDGGAYHHPLVLGHEFAGVVAEPATEHARGVAARPEGSRVAVFPLIPDPAEPINEIGEYALGSTYDYFGSRRDGAFQEYLWVPERNLFPVRDDLSLDHAALVEPCAVAYHAANRPAVQAGSSALVLGGGPIGLMVARWLALRGCAPVVVSEIDERKRDIAQSMGLDVIDAAGDPVATCRERTDGGADVVVEAVGLPITFRQAIASAARFGQVVFLGNIHGDFVLPEHEFSSILRRELTIYGTWNSKITPRGRDEWTRVLAALGDTIDVEPLISHRPTLGDAPRTLAAMHARAEWFNKVVVSVCAEVPR